MIVEQKQSIPSYSRRTVAYYPKYHQGGPRMAKDSQLDPKHIRKEKAKGNPTMAESGADGEGRTHKKQSASRHKPGHDR